MEAPYLKAAGTAAGAVALPEAYFDGHVNEAALHQAIKAHLANNRRGTAAKKNRSAVAGGSRKPWRQKGTGRARQGTIRAVQWRGGGRAFPPRPQSWAQRVPKRVKALAKRSAFNSRAADGRLMVIERWDFETPKTRALVALLAKAELAGRVLLLTKGVNRALHLSSRNLPGVRVLPCGTESAYDVVRAAVVVVEESALSGFGEPSPDGADAPAAADALDGADAPAAADASDGADAPDAADASPGADGPVAADAPAASDAPDAAGASDGAGD